MFERSLSLDSLFGSLDQFVTLITLLFLIRSFPFCLKDISNLVESC